MLQTRVHPSQQKLFDLTATCLCVLCSKDTPGDKKLCFVKKEVFGITDGGPIIGADHPVLKEMFAIPIAGALCCSLIFRGLLLLNPLIAGLGGQVISNQRFSLRRRDLK